MPEVKISEMIIATVLDGSELVEVVQSGANKQAAVDLFRRMVHPGYVAGRWYQPIDGTVSGGSAIPASTVRAIPFVLVRPVMITNLGTRINTAASGGNIQLAIYGAHATTFAPTGAALASTGSISTTSTGTVSAAITQTSVLLQPGLYWMAVNADATAGGTVICQTQGAASSNMSAKIGSTTLANIASGAGTASIAYTVTQTFGSWPDLTGASLSEITGVGTAAVFFRAG